MIEKRNPKKGFVLLIVLALIGVSVLIMSTIATRSSRLAMTAIRKEKGLQVRWGRLSLARWSLARAVSDLESLESDAARDGSAKNLESLTGYRTRLIAGQRWWTIISDESAKFSLPRMQAEFPGPDAQQLSGQIRSSNLRLRRILPGNGSRRWEHWFQSDVGDGANATRHLDAETIVQATQNMTLWGDGKVNLRTCSESVLDALWRALFKKNLPRGLRELDRSQLLSLDEAFSSADLRESERNLANDWFTVASQCQSVWVICESDRRIPAIQWVQWGRGDRREVRGYEYSFSF